MELNLIQYTVYMLTEFLFEPPNTHQDPQDPQKPQDPKNGPDPSRGE